MWEAAAKKKDWEGQKRSHMRAERSGSNQGIVFYKRFYERWNEMGPSCHIQWAFFSLCKGNVLNFFLLRLLISRGSKFFQRIDEFLKWDIALMVDFMK